MNPAGAMRWVMMLFALLLGASGPAAADPLAAQPQKAAVVVEGFRSAKFGMDEMAVRKSIAADFPLKEDAVRRDLHPTEKTAVLSVRIDDLLPDSGSAVASYILGYSSKQLFQVNIAWVGPAARLGGDAMMLRDYFAAQQWPAGKAAADAKLPDGSLLAFRGIDAKGRMVMVVFTPPPAAQGKGTQPDPNAQATLRLSYVEDPEHPDVFQLKPGQF